MVILSCAFGIILSVSRTIDISSQKKREQEAAATAESVKPVAVTAGNMEEDKEYEIMGPGDQFK